MLKNLCILSNEKFVRARFFLCMYVYSYFLYREIERLKFVAQPRFTMTSLSDAKVEKSKRNKGEIG